MEVLHEAVAAHMAASDQDKTSIVQVQRAEAFSSCAAVGSMPQFKKRVLSALCACCRGIDVVRNKIKMFAQKKVTLPPGRHKIVILDEADR
jgi:DNA polymerase III delta prime subunit